MPHFILCYIGIRFDAARCGQRDFLISITMPETNSFHILLPEDGRPVDSLDAYRRQGGGEGLEKARAMAPEDVIAMVKDSGLRGRGGAGFPAAFKWNGVRSDPSEKKYFVCNGSEGEPGTYKDRYLIQKNPYQLIEGILIAVYAIGVEKAFLGLKAKFTGELERVRRALGEFEEAGLSREGAIEIIEGPDEYLFGEEKGLLEVIDGRDARPRHLPPYILGVRAVPPDYNPTVVNNVETCSHVAHILRNGVDWFRSVGSEDTPGTMIFTLCGDVKRPGLYELPMGTPLIDLLEKYGGGPVGDRPFKAVFSGVANAVITPDMFETPLSFDKMREAGSGLGSGGFVAYDTGNCIVKVGEILSRFLAVESCGQCIACKRGSRVITEYLEKLESGHGDAGDIEAIRHECGMVTNQTRCFLAAEEEILISSLLKKFPDEFENHVGHSCPYSRQPLLPTILGFDEESREFRYTDPAAYDSAFTAMKEE